MASVIFGSTLDMLTAATPSSGGKVVAYDLDGILKQKDEFGIITEIGGGPELGLTPSLSEVMGISNIANVPLIMGTSTSILSSNGGGRIDLDYSGSTNSILISTDNASQGEHGILMDDSNYSLFANGYSQALVLHDGTDNIELYNTLGDLKLGVGLLSRDDLKISNNGSSTSSTSDNNKQAVFVGTRNSMMSPGVVNSVIIGGQSITGSQSNYVYIGGSLNINDSYTLPNIDGSSGQLLKSDGLGNIYWSSDVNTSGLSDVLLIDNNSGTHNIIMGTSTNILSSNGSSEIHLDYNGSPNSIYISPDPFLPTNISLDTDISINAANTASVFTGNLQGFVYVTDYSGTFVNNSLVSKLYVDSGTSSLWTAIDNINNDYITEVIGGVGLTGGGTAGVVTLDVNLETNSGLTFSVDDITLELNSNSLEVDSNNQIRLKDTVVGNRTFADSVIISGDLTVSGTATYVNTEELYVADNIITLNATYSSGTPFLDAGVHVLRGSSQSSSIIWDETLEYWALGLSGSESTIITEAGSGLTKTNNELSVDFGTVSSITYVDTQVGNYLPLTGGTMSGSINLSSGEALQLLDNSYINLSTDAYSGLQYQSAGNEVVLYNNKPGGDVVLDGGSTGQIRFEQDGTNKMEFTNTSLAIGGTFGFRFGLSGSFTGDIKSSILTDNRDWIMPNISGTVSLSSDLDTATNSLWIAIDNINNDYITEVIGGQGLTGGGTAGVVTLDAQVNNGLSITSDYIGLGGTLSQNTSINSDGYDITLGDIGYLLFTSSVFDVESDFVSLDSGTGSTQILSGGDTTLSSTNLDLLATDGVYVVGSSFSVNSVEIDPTSATNGQALLFDGVKFSPSTLSGTYLPLAGGTMSGDITNGGYDIYADEITLTGATAIDFGGNLGYITNPAGVLTIRSNKNTTIDANGQTYDFSDSGPQITITGSGMAPGSLVMDASDGTIRATLSGIENTLDLSTLPTTDRSWGMPDATGTVALVSGNPTGDFLPLAGGTMSGNIAMGLNQLQFVGDNIYNDSGSLIIEGNTAGVVLIDDTGDEMEFSGGIGLMTSGFWLDSTTSDRMFEFIQANGTIFGGRLGSSVLMADRTWRLPDASGTIALTSDIINKVSDIRNFTASVAETIIHNLNTEDLIIQTYDSTGLQIIPDTIQINGTASIDVTISQTLTNIKTIII